MTVWCPAFMFLFSNENMILSRFGDHYEWNKVTSCIHNIVTGQRWIEHYGEMAIKNLNGDACQCKVTFVKVRTRRCSILAV